MFRRALCSAWLALTAAGCGSRTGLDASGDDCPETHDATWGPETIVLTEEDCSAPTVGALTAACGVGMVYSVGANGASWAPVSDGEVEGAHPLGFDPRVGQTVAMSMGVDGTGLGLGVSEAGEIVVHRYDPMTGWTEDRVLAPSNGLEAWQTDIGFDGSVLATWRTHDAPSEIHEVWAWTDEGEGPSLLLSATGADVHAIDVAADGRRVVFGWGGGRRWHATKPAGEPWRMTDGDEPREGSVALLPDGRALFVFHSRGGDGGSAVRTAIFDPIADTWSASERLDTGGEAVAEATVATNTKGEAIVSFIQFDDEGTSLWASRRDTSGRWSTAVRIDSGMASVSAPAVGIDESGSSIVVWRQHDPDGTSVWSARASPDVFGPPEPVGTIRLARAEAPALAVGPSGTAIAAWRFRSDGCWQVAANVRR